MESHPHFICTSDIDEQARHYSACVKNRAPYVAISKESGKYAIVTYFSIFMHPFSISRDQLCDMKTFDRAFQAEIDKMPQVLPLVEAFHQGYCDMYGIPRDERITCGGEGAYSFAVLKDHAPFIAEALYRVLQDDGAQLVFPGPGLVM